MAIKNNLLIIALLFFLLFIIRYQIPYRPIKITKENHALNFNPTFLKFTSFGFDHFISSFIWISTLLDTDFERLSKYDHGSWTYLRFVTISKLDEKFYHNYLFGGQFLSVIKNDIPHATIIYKKGLQLFPADVKLLFFTGMHLALEENNPFEAQKLFKKLTEIEPQNSLFLSLYAKLLKDYSSYDLVYNLLLSARSSTPANSSSYEKISNDLYSLKAEHDLNCLNSNEKLECEKTDLNGSAYIKVKNKYFPQKTFIPFKFLKNKH